MMFTTSPSGVPRSALSRCAGVYYIEQGTGTLHYVSIGVTVYYETRGTVYNNAFPPVRRISSVIFTILFGGYLLQLQCDTSSGLA